LISAENESANMEVYAMRITKLKVCNFRSFGPVETVIPLNDMSVLIGSNSTGKTTAMQALIKLFGVYSKDREVVRSDFHVPPTVNPCEMNDASLSIEAVIEFPELYDRANGETGAIPPLFHQMIVSRPGETPYVRIRLSATWNRGNTPEGDIDSKLVFITVAENEDISEETKIPVKSHQRSLIQAVYVPAMRDPKSQIKNESGTILYRLFKAIRWTDGLSDSLKAKSEEVNELFANEPGVNTIGAFIKDHWKDFHDDVKYSEAELGFSETELANVLKRVKISFKPTDEERSCAVEELGDGLRSLFYISLVSALLKLESSCATMEADSGIEIDCSAIPALTILALEEPENHLAPHLLGRVIGLLQNVSEQPNAQVVISTHTPAVVRRVDPENIRYFRMMNDEVRTCVKSITLPPSTGDAFKYVKEAVKAYPELYFAKLVILGEGDSEELIIEKTLQAMNVHIDRSYISIVPLGGRHVNHFWRLLNQLEIPHLTILDLDRERAGGGWGRIKYVLDQLIQLGISRDSLLTINPVTGRKVKISEEGLETMHRWTMKAGDMRRMEKIIVWLRTFGVYFSTPLDVDFMMLKSFQNIYKRASEGSGPRIPDRANTVAFSKKVASAITATLKPEGGKGKTYNETDKELFIWYSYLFLGRGKPVTHLLALKELDNQTLLGNLPEPIKALMDAVVSKRERY
jgi:predicted ATP-dependent endonuclease of OLD family